MSKISQGKQHALVEACKKAGIDVTARKGNVPFSEIVLTGENGRKYIVSKDLQVKPTSRHKIESASQLKNVALIKSEVVDSVYSKPHIVIGNVQRRKPGFRKAKKRNTKVIKIKG